MSGYQGDIQLADTIYWTFTTVSTTGAPTVLTGSPTATAYTDGGTTQSATGVTLTADFDSVVGLNLITVVATGANGFATGETIDIVLDAGTVGGTTVVGYSVGTFSIERNPVNWNRVAAPTTAVDLSGTDIQLCDTTTTNTDVTALNDVAATDIVSAGAITTLSGAIVNVDLVDLCTTTTTNTDVTALNDVAATDIVSSGAITTSGGSVTLVTTTTTATNLTTNNDKTGYALSTAGVDLIWDETLAGHVTADTTGLLLNEWQDGGRLDLILDARMAEASIDTTGGAVDTVTAVTNDVGITATAVNLIWDEAMTETTGAPAVTASFREGLKWMFALSRNKLLQTATLTTLRNDADGGDLATSVVADDATTYTRNEWST